MVPVMKKIKAEICNYIILKEWIENGEFINTNVVIVIGTKIHARFVNFRFRGSGIKVYYNTELRGAYHYKKWVKWIIFDTNLKRKLPCDDFNLLFIPKL